MFDKSTPITTLVDRFCNQHDTLSRPEARHLIRVELGIRLMQTINVDSRPLFIDEPVSALPALLSGMEYPRLRHLDKSQRSMILKARLLIPFDASSAWDRALDEYSGLPLDLLLYKGIPEFGQDCQIANLDVDNRLDYRFVMYDDTLTGHLNWSNQEARDFFVKPGESFRMTLATRSERIPQITLENLQIPASEYPELPEHPRFPFAEGKKREPIHISLNDLQSVAKEMDKCLSERGLSPQWEARLYTYIHHHPIEIGQIAATPSGISLQGIQHIVGMVGSGKSTLMKLIGGYFVLRFPNKRLTLVVGDTMTALSIANELNQIFVGSDPHNGKPVAITLMGRSTRDYHLARFHTSIDNVESHWGMRWLQTVCPLMGLLGEKINDFPDAVIPGREPCQQLDVSKPNSKHANYKSCPFTYGCKSHQQYHDLADATVTVTTPGAMSKSKILAAFDARRLTYGEFLYLHTDAIVFDEVDTIVSWFDDEYATVLDLWGTPRALFNQIDPDATGVLTSVGRERRQHESRWIRATRRSSEAIDNILDQVASSRQEASRLRFWLGRRYFTAYHLFMRLARSLYGVWERTRDNDIDDQTLKKIGALQNIFEKLTEDDPVRMPRPKSGDQDPTFRLANIMARAVANDVEEFVTECEEWIQDTVEDVDTNLENLNARIEELNQPYYRYPTETLASLAQKLALTLMTVLLDHHLRIVFYEWHSRPSEIETSDFSGAYLPNSLSLADILPLPAVGRIFGTYYTQDKRKDEEQRLLSRFEYSNIGRIYVQQYHQLLEALDLFGPHVVALSGTSWLPDSTRWNFAVEPTGIMKIDDETATIIREGSQFAFIPQYTTDKEGSSQPILVSGSADIDRSVQQLAQSLLATGQIQKELDKLSELGRENPLWQDRARLLMLTNSYDQAEIVGRVLQQELGHERVHYLTRGNSATEADVEQGTIARADIEQFADSPAQILVAPMNAIGRGYNILNRETEKPMAAFGAVYFLIRPMPHPYDIQALASELNARSLEWVENEDLWHEFPTLDQQYQALRRYTRQYWLRAEDRHSYRDINWISQQTIDEADTELEHQMLTSLLGARMDLAATTLGRFVQASGRLVRGGVPFRCFFVDASWAPRSAAFIASRSHGDEMPTEGVDIDNPTTSLLSAMVTCLLNYTEHPIGKQLYEPFEGLLDTADFWHNPYYEE